MHEFFKPWRRKIGVVTLGLACVLMGEWIRGLTIQDTLVWTFEKTEFEIRCLGSSLLLVVVQGWHSAPPSRFPKWDTGEPVSIATFGPIWKVEWCAFRYTTLSTEIQTVTMWTIPIWSIMLPLTLLSAYLLLGKPRQTAPKQTSEPSPTTGE